MEKTRLVYVCDCQKAISQVLVGRNDQLGKFGAHDAFLNFDLAGPAEKIFEFF